MYYEIFFFKKFTFFYLFMTVLSLRFCARAFSSCGDRGLIFIAVCGLFFIAVCGLLIAVASLVAEHGL